MKLALVQLQRSRKKEENIEYVLNLLKGLQADVILLPENWLGAVTVPLEEYLVAVKEITAQLPSQTLLAAGAQYVEADNKVISRGAFVRGQDEEFIYYEKHFPSRAVGERENLRPGRLLPIVEHAGWKLAAVICVDLFYPEIARHLALSGCELILNPASLPHNRLPLWQSLGLIRAAENTIYVATANSTGGHYTDGREIAGGSFVAFPNGNIGAVAGNEQQVLVIELDRGLVARTRERWPYLEDIRFYPAGCAGKFTAERVSTGSVRVEKRSRPGSR